MADSVLDALNTYLHEHGLKNAAASTDGGYNIPTKGGWVSEGETTTTTTAINFLTNAGLKQGRDFTVDGKSGNIHIKPDTLTVENIAHADEVAGVRYYLEQQGIKSPVSAGTGPDRNGKISIKSEGGWVEQGATTDSAKAIAALQDAGLVKGTDFAVDARSGTITINPDTKVSKEVLGNMNTTKALQEATGQNWGYRAAQNAFVTDTLNTSQAEALAKLDHSNVGDGRDAQRQELFDKLTGSTPQHPVTGDMVRKAAASGHAGGLTFTPEELTPETLRLFRENNDILNKVFSPAEVNKTLTPRESALSSNAGVSDANTPTIPIEQVLSVAMQKSIDAAVKMANGNIKMDTEFNKPGGTTVVLDNTAKGITGNKTMQV